MTDLSPEARRLLVHARAGQARASQALRARVKLQVERATYAADGGGIGGAERGSSSRPWFLPAVGTLLVISGLAVVAAVRPSAARPSSAVLEAVESPRPQPVAARARADAAQATLPAVVEQRATQAPGSREPAEGSQPSAASEVAPRRPARRATPQPADSAEALRAEMQLLSRAEAALRADEPQQALEVLGTHAQRFRNGQLQQEHDGLRLIAQCALGRDPGAALARYSAKRSDAVLRARVLEACARFMP